MTLRHDLQLLLPSEPCFCFAPERIPTAQTPKLVRDIWQTCIVPSVFSLRIPVASALGFANHSKTADVLDTVLHLAIPRLGLPSFRSLAEAVIRTPNPVSVGVTLGSCELDAQEQLIVSEALKWMESNPVGFHRQMSALNLAPALGEHLQKQLQAWFQNPAGARLECQIDSPIRLNDSFAKMVGEDVFGSRVKLTTPTTTDEGKETSVVEEQKSQVKLNLALHGRSEITLRRSRYEALWFFTVNTPKNRLKVDWLAMASTPGTSATAASLCNQATRESLSAPHRMPPTYPSATSVGS